MDIKFTTNVNITVATNAVTTFTYDAKGY